LTPTLRVGVVGLGKIAVEHHLPNWVSSPHCTLSAVCDVDAGRLASTGDDFFVSKRYADWRDLVADPSIDVVDVCTPNAWHAPVALAALESGKHVLCEKPMATNSRDAERMLEASRRRQRKLQVNHHFRFQRAFREIQKFSTEPTLGRPYFAHARWHRRRRVPVAPTFVQRELSGGGPLLDLGVHIVDLAMLLMGFPQPVEVSASVGAYLGRRPDLGGDWGDWNPAEFDVEDFACLFCRFQDDATLFVETSWLGFHESSEEWFVKVLGTRAGLHWPAGLVVGEADKVRTDRRLPATKEAPGEPYRRSIHEFAEAVVLDRPAPVPPEQSLTVVRLIEAAYRSAECKRAVLFA
jgi:predicted dehydrogenase